MKKNREEPPRALSYFVLMAITGLSDEATAAGTIPAIIPIKAETPTPRVILSSDNTTCSDPNGINDIRYTRNIPTPPPITLKNIASNKN